MDNDLDLVVEVVSAYAQKNKMSQSELIELIRAVHGLFVESRRTVCSRVGNNKRRMADLWR